MSTIERELLGISERAYSYVRQCESELTDVFAKIDDVEAACQARVLAAFQHWGYSNK